MIAGCAASMLFPAATTDGDIFLADCQMYGSAITVYGLPANGRWHGNQ
jgi:hypothetical protein